MKARKYISLILFGFTVVSCAPITNVIGTDPALFTQEYTTSLSTPVATFRFTPEFTATPLQLTLDAKTTIDNVIKQLLPDICAGLNLAKETPPPQDVPAPYPLKFINIGDPPDEYYIEEIADNYDKSRQAYIACDPNHCKDDVYVRDNKTNDVFRIDFGAMAWRPIMWLEWINDDTLLFVQSSNPHYGLVVVINVEKQEYQYYGMAVECSVLTQAQK